MDLDPQIMLFDVIDQHRKVVTNAVSVHVPPVVRADDRKPVPGIYPFDDPAPPRIESDLQDPVTVPQNIAKDVIDQNVEVVRLRDSVQDGLVVGEEPIRAR